MDDKESPAEPAAGDKGRPTRGGFAEAAKALNREHPNRRRPISRQLVHKWCNHRHFNMFPEPVDWAGSGNGGKGSPVFNIEAVVTWYAEYLRTRRRDESAEERPRATAPRTTATDDDTLAA